MKTIKQSSEAVKQVEVAVTNKSMERLLSLKKKLSDLLRVPQWMRHAGLEEYWSGHRQDRIVKCWVRRLELDLRAIESRFLFVSYRLLPT